MSIGKNEVFDLLDLEVNIPSQEFGSYTTHLSAPPKFGKSEFCTQFPKPLIFDFEEGTAGKVVFRVPVTKWSQVRKYISQLIKNPALKGKYQTICFDTTNYALEACKQYVMDDYQSKNPDKVIDTFNKIPWGGGHELLSKEFKTQINSLKRAGYGVVFVSHVKDKTFDKDSEQEHTKTVPDLSDKERNMISAMADFLLLGEFELEVIEPAVKDGNNKVIREAVIKTNRVLYLRTNEEAEAGFRWEDCPEKIEFSYEKLNDVFDVAVAKEISKGKAKFGLSDDKADEIREKLDEIKEQEIEEVFAEKIEDVVAEILEKVEELRKKKVAIKTIKELCPVDPVTLNDLDEAKSILKGLQTLG